MAALPKVLYRVNAGVTETTVSVPTAKRWIVTSIVVANIHATSTAKATMKLGGFVLFNNVSIPASTVFTLDCAQALDATGAVAVKADIASALTFHVSGVEMDV